MRNIVKGLRKDKRFIIKVLSRESKEVKQENLTITPFNSLIVNIYDKTKKILKIFGLNFHIHFFQILSVINKFKPNIIITEFDCSFSSIICAKIKHVPVIHIVRGCYKFCPTYANITSYRTGCEGLKNRKICYKCIENWRTLKFLVTNDPIIEQGLKSLIHTVFYKFEYFIVRFHYWISSKSTISVVASSLMKKFLSSKIDPEKIKIMNITPIRRRRYPKLKKSDKENTLLTIVLGIYKGSSFILRLSKIIPKLNINAVGMKTNYGNKNVICLNKVPNKDIDMLYQESVMTLVPSIQPDTFGRVVIESLVNKTPVITSPNVGASDYFIGRDYVKCVPLKTGLWMEAIKEMIKNPPVISNRDIEDIYNQFSINKSKKDFIKLIIDILKCDRNG